MRTVDVTVSAQNTAWSTPVPNGLKNYVKDVQIVHFCDNATMTRLVKWKFCQFCPEMRVKVLYRSVQHSL